ncbi:flagellar motor switch protein FliM [Endozoicomonas arenosclerae]|uniref:flagellar motor switch protein FliM n=1 Tax=Endozoicomonas arenosclerae TaxID=1633495 RepID=UPI000780D9B4|nr:flagellar motor switch protein FliM [Endozoicomonas arenosclerae]
MKKSVPQDVLNLLVNNSRKTNEKVSNGESYANVKSYDLTNPDYKIHDLLPTLELIYRRFAQNFRHSLYNLLHTGIEAKFERVDSLKYGDYINENRSAEVQHLFRVQSLKCSGFFALDIKLVSAMVELFFGGPGDSSDESDREMTQTELRMVRRFLKSAIENLQQSWETILPFRVRLPEYDSNPVSTIFTSDAELILVSRFRLKLANKEGHLHIILPYRALEPVREKLHTFKFTEQDPEWRQNLRNSILMAPVEMSATLCNVQLSLEQVLKLQVGDIIQADMPKLVSVKVAGIPCLQASVCRDDDMLALKVSRKVNSKIALQNKEEV